MDLFLTFLGILALLAVPVGIYWIRVMPRLEGPFRALMIVGACMAVASLVPMVGMAELFMGMIWQVTVAALLVVHGAVWIWGAVRKQEPFMLGALATGVTVAVSSALIGNWIALAVALIYLAVLARCRFDVR
ncbi:MAG: hypothetical protein IJW45_01895 [Oscillospiraceae bacterium]|nr:hypothetical protein [Oscillospiraceae bacterium]